MPTTRSFYCGVLKVRRASTYASDAERTGQSSSLLGGIPLLEMNQMMHLLVDYSNNDTAALLKIFPMSSLVLHLKCKHILYCYNCIYYRSIFVSCHLVCKQYVLILFSKTVLNYTLEHVFSVSFLVPVASVLKCQISRTVKLQTYWMLGSTWSFWFINGTRLIWIIWTIWFWYFPSLGMKLK